MGEKVTKMVLKVDLQCSKCYKKVKKILCKFPEIQEQFFDEKTNTVTIKVVSCSPEKIRDKLCCKGDGSIKTIEIPPPPPPPKPNKKDTDPPPKPNKKDTDPPPKPKPPAADADADASSAAAAAVHVNVINSVGACWCYGRPVYCSCGCGNRVCYIGRCSDYICEANPAAPCTIM